MAKSVPTRQTLGNSSENWGRENNDWVRRSVGIPSEVLDRVSLLCRAIEARDESSVRSMLNLYSDLNPNNQLPGLTLPLLHFAVGLSENSPEVVKLLLEMGGDPNKLATEEKISPMHLCVMNDFDVVLASLMREGGDPKKPNGDGKNCYDLAICNVEEELREKCFIHFYKRSLDFRKSIKPSDSLAKLWKNTHSQSLSFSNLSDGFVTCESEFEQVEVEVKECGEDDADCNINSDFVYVEEQPTPEPEQSGGWRRPMSYLMTEDESDSSRDDGRLSTIEEESALSTSYQRKLGYDETKVNATSTQASLLVSPRTPARPAPTSRILEHISEEISTPNSGSSTLTDNSCVNTPPPVISSPPTKEDIKELQNVMKQGKFQSTIPITQSTFHVVNRFALQDQARLAEALAPKPGTQHFSSELRLGSNNLHLIDEWGNLKVDFLQTLTTPVKKSKSFYNYLLLDPKILKKVNFSGAHLKSDVIKNPEKFETFLRSVFYIGKGCGKRPIQHLVDAKLKYGTGRKIQTQVSCGEKIDKIMDIWKSGLGVTVVSVFHHSSEKEANVNEAAMIDAMGLVDLSNVKKGSYTGTIANTWSQKTKNQFGTFLLYKSFCSFAVGEHKSFSAQDV